jgi:hypothetical protein
LDKSVDMSGCLVPDFGREPRIRPQLIGVTHLVCPVASCTFGNDTGLFDHVLCQLLRHLPAITRNDGQLSPENAHVIKFLARECIGGHDIEGMTLHRADQRQRHTRAPASIFHHRAASRKAAIDFGRFNHGERHAILHAAGRILVLELE